jgi:adenosylcobinamide-GDP ribazoletransferase
MIRARLAELAAALMLLTRLPAGLLPAPAAPARAVWAYPLVGALVGGIGAVVDLLGRRAGLPPPLAAVWTLAAMVLVTGGLHEDGLADTADGFGGGATKERKLAIMRDSRIGTYGVLALGLALAARGTAIAALAHPGAALVVAGAGGRAVIAALVALLPAARPDGLGAAVARPGLAGAAVAGGIGVVLAVLLLPGRLVGPAILACVVAGGLVAGLARRQIGGQTGDVLGATSVGVEVLVLTVLVGLVGKEALLF